MDNAVPGRLLNVRFLCIYILFVKSIEHDTLETEIMAMMPSETKMTGNWSKVLNIESKVLYA